MISRCEWINCPYPAQFILQFEGYVTYCCQWHKKNLEQSEGALGHPVKVIDRIVVNFGTSPHVR